ncbi:signal peptidase II [Lacticaseibacillus daqingensis]|uniref:signal peptidase II n=1 Tax=Lacticaseibacillus daqingensis TaxID=2486014 RepID=UPI000F77E896|nr:signal peptidase II [Lacticaseibacillus daqingensis]
MISYLIIAAALVGLDQWVKAWIIGHVALGQTVGFIPGVVSLTHIKNTGAAFSILEGKQWFFYIITVVSLIIVGMLWRDAGKSRWYRLGLTLIVAGTLGNVIDRLRFQEVTDMFQLDFMNFAIFNVADACLTVGVLIVLVYLLFFDGKGAHR